MPSGLHITVDGGSTLWWSFGEVRQTQGFYAGEPVRLERGRDITEALVVADVAFLRALRAIGPGLTGHLHDPARRRARVRLTVLAALGAVALTVALYLWGIPAAAGLAAARVPIAWEERLGDAVVAHLAPPARRCADAGRQRIIDDILRRLAPLPPSGYALRVIVTREATVNAFAAPGGQIVVLRGLLERTESAEQLAGVLAHEAQHVLLRHTTRALLQHASTGLLVAAVAGDVSGLTAFGFESARTLGALSYSRVSEAEADREGFRMLAAAGIDPAGMIAFFESLERGGDPSRARNLTRYLSSHPLTGDRIRTLRALAAASSGTYARLLPDYDWRDIARICAGPASGRPAEPTPTR
jgi:predicted Zn-dependent protease